MINLYLGGVMNQVGSFKEKYYQELKDPRWIEKSREIRSKAGWKCQKCGSINKTLHTHHKFYVSDDDSGRYPWEYHDDAFEVLCVDCHYGLHDARDKLYQEFLDQKKAKYEKEKDDELLSKEFDICIYCGSKGVEHKFDDGLIIYDIDRGCCQKCIHENPVNIICKQCNGFINKIYGCMNHLVSMIKPFILDGYCSVCIYNSHKMFLETRKYSNGQKSSYQRRQDFLRFMKELGVRKISDQEEISKKLPWLILDREKSRLHRYSDGIISPHTCS